MNMYAEFYFHPIGQGCFYSGLIHNTKDKLFSFVYDCGTDSKMSYLEKEVDRFKKLINNKLDLLIISHFDADHVNGVVRLLEKVDCRRLIIPYYTPIERLLLYATADNMTDDYRRLLQNPFAFFGNDNEFRIDEIIVIGGPEDGTVAESEVVLPPTDDGGEFNEVKAAESDFKFHDLSASNSSHSFKKEIENNGDDPTLARNVSFFRTPYKVVLGNAIWEFAFYLKKMDDAVLVSKFTTDVDVLLKAHDISVFDLFDDEYIKKLKAIYRRYYGDNLNATSLVTYHGPLSSRQHLFWCNDIKHHYNQDELPYGDYYCDCYYPKHSINVSGTLLTGDIDISGPRLLNKVLRYFNTYISKICIFQVPHHGSKENWPILTSPNAIHSFYHYVINHGIGRQHHPGVEVIADIKAKCRNKRIHLNNEIYPFYYRFDF